MTMDPNPKSAKLKIAFTGTNCSGKTTTALEVTARLKAQHHYLAEVVSSQDRKITWKDDHFPVDPRAHFGMISNLILAETQAELKGDADVVITDRSVLDLYAIALTDHPHDQLIADLGVAVRAWLKTYTKVYYLPPLPYQEDGKRPADDFRMRTHATLVSLIDSGEFSNVERIADRSEIMTKVRGVLGIKSESNPILAEKAKWTALASVTNATIAVKHGSWPLSDTDVWVITDNVAEFSRAYLEEVVDMIFGDQVPVHLMLLPTAGTEELKARHAVTLYEPEVLG